MVSTMKKKRPPKARIPSEIIAMESILKTGSIRFRCQWQIYDFGSGPDDRTPHWQTLKSKSFKFSAGAMEEVLAAVHGAVLAAAQTPGAKLEGGWRKFCPRCGRLMTVVSEHECPDIGGHIEMMNAKRLTKMSERGRSVVVAKKHIHKAQYDGEKLLDECAICGESFRNTDVHCSYTPDKNT